MASHICLTTAPIYKSLKYIFQQQNRRSFWPTCNKTKCHLDVTVRTSRLERRTGDRIPLRQLRFGTLAIPFTPLRQRLSEETRKAIGPFYLMFVPGEVKDPTSLHWKSCVTSRGRHQFLRRTTLCMIFKFE